MRLVRLLLGGSLVLLTASRGLAQVSCANPDDLCTGDPCTITTTEVLSPCVVDFGARHLIIAGAIDVPSGGTLDWTAAKISLLGTIDGRHVGNGVGSGAAVSLTSTVNEVDLRGEIDVTGTAANGSITIDAATDIFVKDPLNAKTSGANVTATGGVISLTAGATIVTDQSAVLDARGADTTAAGSVAVSAAGLVNVAGRVFAEGQPGGTIDIESTAGAVVIEKDLRVGSEIAAAGTIVVSGATGVTITDKLRAASSPGTGGSVTIDSSGGSISLEDSVNVRGLDGGSVTIAAPAGTLTPLERVSARGKMNGGIVSLSAATLDVRGDVDVRGSNANGGSIQLLASVLARANRTGLIASGKTNAGSIALLGDAGSGDVDVVRSSFAAKGSSGLGGTVTISAPAGSVTMDAKVYVTGRDGQGGQVHVDGIALTVGGKTIIDAKDGGEVRFEQTGVGLFTLTGSFVVRDGGVVEALAPVGSLTAVGKALTDGGCVGLSAGGTLDTTAFASDVPILASCP